MTLHHWLDAKDKAAFVKEVGNKIKAIAIAYTANKVDGNFLQQFPTLEQVSSFGVGYDHIDAKWAGEHGIVVTNTPEVLNEEVADTALGLLLCTVRELPQAERYLRAGKWKDAHYPLTKATLRDRTVGMVGMGRIGKAIARRLEAFGVPVVYHTRNPQAGRQLQVLSEAPRHGARRRHADGDRARRRQHQEHDQCRGAQGARPKRHPDQHGARLGGRRAGADRGAAESARSTPPASTCSPTSRMCRRS